MMKAGTKSHIKFARLKRRLQLPDYALVGILESLWLATAQNTPRGDIGKLSNEDIAAVIDWPDDPDKLIEALLAAGWLEEHPEHRLVIHDWADHCPRYVRGNLAHMAVSFAHSAEGSTEHSTESPTEHSTESSTECSAPASTQAKPSQAKPSQAKPRDLSLSEDGKLTRPEPAGNNHSAEIREVFRHYRTYHPKAVPKPRSDSKEWRKIAARFAAGWTVAELKAAIDGCHKSPWHQGDNETGTKYQALELIMRDDSHVQQFIEHSVTPRKRYKSRLELLENHRQDDG